VPPVRLTAVSASCATVTVTFAVRVLVVKPAPLPVAMTVIVALPGATPVTTPVLAFTDAILVALVLYA